MNFKAINSFEVNILKVEFSLQLKSSIVYMLEFSVINEQKRRRKENPFLKSIAAFLLVGRIHEHKNYGKKQHFPSLSFFSNLIKPNMSRKTVPKWPSSTFEAGFWKTLEF